MRKVGPDTRLMAHLDELNALLEKKALVEEDLAWVKEDIVVVQKE